MSTPAAVIQAGGGGGGVSSIPGGWRTVVIAGGALAALVAVLLQRSGGGGSSGDEGSNDVDGLSTSANVALGQVAYEQRTASGEASRRDADLMDALNDAFSRLTGDVSNVHGLIGMGHELTDAQHSALMNQLTSVYGLVGMGNDLSDAQNRAIMQQLLDQSGLIGQGNELSDAQNRAIMTGLFGELGRLRTEGNGAGAGSPPPGEIFSTIPAGAGAPDAASIVPPGYGAPGESTGNTQASLGNATTTGPAHLTTGGA